MKLSPLASLALLISCALGGAGCGSADVEPGTNLEMASTVEYRSGYQAGRPIQVRLRFLPSGAIEARVERSGKSAIELSGRREGTGDFFHLRASQGGDELVGHLVKNRGSFSFFSEEGATVGHLELADRPNGGKTVQFDVRPLSLTIAEKSISERPPILANLALARQILNTNLEQQLEIDNQQAMNQVNSSTLSKVFLLVEEELSPLRVSIEAHVVQSKRNGPGRVSHSIWESGTATRTQISGFSGELPNLSFDFVLEGLRPAALPGNEATGTARLAGRIYQSQP